MKSRTLITIELLLMVVGVLVVSALTHQLFNNATAHFISNVGLWIVMFTVGNQDAKRRTKHLTQMWQLADQLGYGPAELKRREPKYGSIDWQLSRPESRQFYPNDKVVVRLIQQFEDELKQQA